MAIIVDYLCPDCRSRAEAFVVHPVPATRACESCGGESRRRWSPVGIVSRTPDAPAVPSRPALPRPARSLCADNPDVPGLCHMSPTAGRAWVARYRGDHRALDAELEKQQKAAAVSPPTMADAISHEHSHTGHTH